MYDPVSPQLPQEVKKVSYDTINIKLKSVGDQVSLQDSVKVNNTTGTTGKDSQMTSSTAILEEVDLMNFDGDWLSSDDNNDPIREVVQDVQVSIIDQLLCDLNFGRDYKDEMKSENVNDVQENKMIQNKQVTSKPLEQETPKKEMDYMTQNKPNRVSKVPPVSSFVNSTKETPPFYPSYADPINGTRPLHTSFMNAEQTSDPSRVKTVNGMRPTVVPCTHNMKEPREDIISTMEMKRQSPVDKPRKRRIYSFLELLIYQFSPVTEELYNSVGKRFSVSALDYDLLNDHHKMVKGQSRRPGTHRDTAYGRWDRIITSSRHFESPSELSFLKECVVAQNRWTALLKDRELRTSRRS